MGGVEYGMQANIMHEGLQQHQYLQGNRRWGQSAWTRPESDDSHQWFEWLKGARRAYAHTN